MPSLLELLAGDMPSEQDYLLNNPFYSAGRAVSGWNLPAQTNSEAIWGPALQGLLGGFLTSYGQRDARNEAWNDYTQNPLLKTTSPGLSELLSADYASETAPDGWTAKKGRSDLLMSALQGEAIQAAADKKAERQFELDKFLLGHGLARTPEGGYAPSQELIAAKAQAAGAVKEAELGVSGKVTPEELKSERTTQAGLQQTLDFIDDQFDAAKNLAGAQGGEAILGGLTGMLGFPTDASQKLKGMGQAISFQVDKTLGKEINSDVRQQQLNALTVRATDSDAMIDWKREQMKDFIRSLSKATPNLDATRATTKDVPQETVVAPDGNTYVFID